MLYKKKIDKPPNPHLRRCLNNTTGVYGLRPSSSSSPRYKNRHFYGFPVEMRGVYGRGQ